MNYYRFLLLVPFVWGSALYGEVVPSALFRDHCVLQRGERVPVWGTADPGETVTVRFRGRKEKTRAGQLGKWQVMVKTGEAGGPFTLKIQGADNVVRVSDVLVGEVWLASGQSNMERQLGPRTGQKPIINGMAEASKADYPRFRQFYVPKNTAEMPIDSVDGKWTVCSPETANDFTAVGFFFGRDLLEELDVPIGIIHSSWGGTPAQAWTSEEAVSIIPQYAAEIEERRKSIQDPENAYSQFFNKLEAWYADNDSGSAHVDSWSTLSMATDEWESMWIPQMWDDAGLDKFDGIVWLRTTFTLPVGWDESDLLLELGAVDDIDTTWINGNRIGQTVGWMTRRRYPIPASILHPGENVILVRVLDTGGGGGIWDTTQPPLIRSTNGDSGASVSLSGEWSFRKSLSLGDAPSPPRGPSSGQNRPSMLYNAMIAPLVPYAIRGVIWYQGESNAGDPAGYRKLFPAMIEDWRKQWDRGAFPFLFVQIAPYEGQPPEIREAQFLTLGCTGNTAMVVTMDVGDATDIHPANKGPVGERLSLAARALAYDEDIVYSGPLYQSVSFQDGVALIHFTNVGPGLIAADDKPLRGFTIAGENGVFYPADARIEGTQVVVSSPQVATPVAVRYGWTNVPDGNLFNKAGLPASPFRTDVN